MSNMMNMFGGGNTTNQPLINSGYQGAPSGASANVLGNYGNILNQYGSLYNQAGANQGGYVQSVVDPTIQTNAAQYGNLMQDQANRGIRGSEFGDQSISNFTNAANTNVANSTSNALQQSMGLQSGILGNMSSTIGGLGNYLNAITGQGMNYNLGMLANNRAGSAQNAGMFGGLMNGMSGLFGGSGSGGSGNNWLSSLFGSGSGGTSTDITGALTSSGGYSGGYTGITDNLVSSLGTSAGTLY